MPLTNLCICENMKLSLNFFFFLGGVLSFFGKKMNYSPRGQPRGFFANMNNLIITIPQKKKNKKNINICG